VFFFALYQKITTKDIEPYPFSAYSAYWKFIIDLWYNYYKSGLSLNFAIFFLILTIV